MNKSKGIIHFLSYLVVFCVLMLFVMLIQSFDGTRNAFSSDRLIRTSSIILFFDLICAICISARSFNQNDEGTKLNAILAGIVFAVTGLGPYLAVTTNYDLLPILINIGEGVLFGILMYACRNTWLATLGKKKVNKNIN